MRKLIKIKSLKNIFSQFITPLLISEIFTLKFKTRCVTSESYEGEVKSRNDLEEKLVAGAAEREFRKEREKPGRIDWKFPSEVQVNTNSQGCEPWDADNGTLTIFFSQGVFNEPSLSFDRYFSRCISKRLFSSDEFRETLTYVHEVKLRSKKLQKLVEHTRNFILD